MISLNFLAQKLQEKLNLNSLGYEFNVVVDTGDVKDDKRVINDVQKYVNCVLRSVSSEMTNLTDGTIVATQDCSFSLIVRLEDTEEDGEKTGEFSGVYLGELDEQPENANYGEFYCNSNDGFFYAYIDNTWLKITDFLTIELEEGEENEYFIKTEPYEGYKSQLQKLREFLDNTLVNSSYESISDGEKTWAVTTVYQLVNSGIRDQVERLGDSFTFNYSIFYMFIENGVNSQDLKYFIDGNRIPFSSNSTYQTPTMDGNVYAGTTDGRTKNLASQSTFQMVIELPALNNIVTDIIFEFLFDGGINEAHIVQIKRENKPTKNYLMTFSEAVSIGETIKNVGNNITLVEIPPVYDLISAGSKLKVYRCIQDVGARTFSFNKEGVLFNFAQENYFETTKTTTGYDLTFTNEKTITNGSYVFSTLTLSSTYFTEL